MNNFTNSNETSLPVITFPYIVAISAGILLLFTSLTLASYFCTKFFHPPAARRPHAPLHLGLDERVIDTYPKLLFSEAKTRRKPDAQAAGCCSICLADYRNADVVRLLPECGHVFHRRCIDPWLRLKPSCPICRSSPEITPEMTPVAEMVPLVIGRS